MLTALTCEWEMLTFPLPARIKTLARDTEHDHTSSSTDFILKKVFFQQACRLWIYAKLEGWPSRERSWSLRNKCLVTKNVREKTPFLILPFSGSGSETNGKRQQCYRLHEKQTSIAEANALDSPSHCVWDMPKMNYPVDWTTTAHSRI